MPWLLTPRRFDVNTDLVSSAPFIDVTDLGLVNVDGLMFALYD